LSICARKRIPNSCAIAVCDGIAEVADRFTDLLANVEHIEFFRPGKPRPTHRDVALADRAE
jgi:hypothetical protein